MLAGAAAFGVAIWVLGSGRNPEPEAEGRATNAESQTLDASLEDLFDAWWVAASYDGWLNPIVSFDGGLAAISRSSLPDPWSEATATGDVWLSSDGELWGPAPTQPPAKPWTLSSDGSTLFAQTGDGGDAPTVWASRTGTDWRPVLTADDYELLLNLPWLWRWDPWDWWWGFKGGAVAAGPMGAVVFGIDRDGRLGALAWNGERFVPASLGGLATLPPHATEINVTALDEGFLLSAHDIESGDGSQASMMVSFSSTGASWSELQPPPPLSPLAWPEPHVITTASRQGMNLVLMDAGYGLWATDDGSSWSEIVLGDDRRPSPHVLPHVAGGDLGWVVSFGQHLWYSADTESWTELDDLGPLGGDQATLIVASDHLLAFARAGSGTAGRTEVWRLDIDPPALAGATATTTTTDATAGEWNPILTETQAGAAPPAAGCPPGTDPDRKGPSDQPRPDTRQAWDCHPPYGCWEPPVFTNLAASFDRHAGRIVYVDALDETWTFDVCTNTWHQMNSTGTVSDIEGSLVYDIDSDITVALHAGVSAYDATTNSWTQPYPHLADGRFLVEPRGAVYDPISGLILTLTRPATTRPDDFWLLWAYDVDADTWTTVGPLLFEAATPYCTGINLLGYLPEVDRLVLATHDESCDRSIRSEIATLLLDPRTGEITMVSADTPVVIRTEPPISRSGPVDDTVYVANSLGPICGFDVGTSTWTRCLVGPDQYLGFGALVGDPISNRLVLISGITEWSWWSESGYGYVDGREDLLERMADTGVWAIDLDTGELAELVPSAGNPPLPAD